MKRARASCVRRISQLRSNGCFSVTLFKVLDQRHKMAAHGRLIASATLDERVNRRYGAKQRPRKEDIETHSNIERALRSDACVDSNHAPFDFVCRRDKTGTMISGLRCRISHLGYDRISCDATQVNRRVTNDRSFVNREIRLNVNSLLISIFSRNERIAESTRLVSSRLSTSVDAFGA